MAPPTATPHVLLVPFPAQGHALPLYDLAALLAARGLRLTVVTTPGNAAQLAPLLAAHPDSVRPLVLPFPSHPSLPAGLENTMNCPPVYIPVFIHALAALHRPILAWARSQPAHPVVAVVSDFFCGWTQPLAAEIGVPRVVFTPSGVLGTAVPHSLFRRLVKRPVGCDDGFPVAFPAIPGEPAFEWREISMLYKAYIEGLVEEQVGESLKQNCLWNLEGWGFVSNTFPALEGRYLDAPLEDLGFKRVWAVGPVAPDTDAAGERGGEAAVAAGDLSAWLDAFPEGSVVYVCFGSQAVLTPAMAAALAEALERSAVPFVWVVSGDGVVPEGFEARAAAAARGMVVRGWAPQVAALRHAAVGWFMTHCGWNSVLEAVAAGVPMLAWPMAADQFVNARLLVEDAGVALRACAGGAGVAPDAGELAAVLADAVGEKGSGARARAKELAADAAIAVRSGGSSYEDLERFVQEIQKL
ncbi:flavonol 3-O-glucosyltransferase UGT89B1-like [Oryza glaberrima]|uniref:Glycosyltransferase n=1 Tax=Oryza glaberrima TaxID=4538 RepID=I1PQC0_ORYGL|nr:flavonol 3-O-glucosyltransferase UGT89B1-like [Oryza glaberrima]XP_052152711.1 flavonol 3-O-glucosyltransferase UGT89B1-like [Oryza glaberrima]XP_052152712.1 flavonol 3-O-glucosyltransferase UGT89B1-like [Oryza glaberrima]